MSEEIIVKDSNGNQLQNGDSVTVIKDLKVKGSSDGIKRGTVLKNIQIDEDDPMHITSSSLKKTFVKVEFVKKI